MSTATTPQSGVTLTGKIILGLIALMVVAAVGFMLLWVSGVGVVIPGYLAYEGFRLSRQSTS